MAKFLDTTGISYHLEQIIKNANERLVLISPFLKINDRIKELLEDKDRLKIDIRVIYGKNELQPEENNWLKSMNSIRSSFCKNLHAKCYMNEKEALITSMNLYEFSQSNNNEMGIHVTRESDQQLYLDIDKEAKRLIRISDEIKVSVEKVDKVKDDEKKDHYIDKSNNSNNSNTKYLTTKDLSQYTGFSSRKINEWLVDNKLMYKKDEDWVATKKGNDKGALQKEGAYGKFIIWPDSILTEIKKI